MAWLWCQNDSWFACSPMIHENTYFFQHPQQLKAFPLISDFCTSAMGKIVLIPYFDCHIFIGHLDGPIHAFFYFSVGIRILFISLWHSHYSLNCHMYYRYVFLTLAYCQSICEHFPYHTYNIAFSFSDNCCFCKGCAP